MDNSNARGWGCPPRWHAQHARPVTAARQGGTRGGSGRRRDGPVPRGPLGRRAAPADRDAALARGPAVLQHQRPGQLLAGDDLLKAESDAKSFSPWSCEF